jgi:Lon protease-like protein
MFPLGTVLVPGAVLPLHVFEERYRALVRDVLEGDGEFGVVLIERGSEVGGGDTRTPVGTMARLARAEEQPDGRWLVIAVGERRIRVVGWEPDDPYPRARVHDWPDEDAPGNAQVDRFETVAALWRTALGLAAELGREVAPLDLTLPPDPGPGSFALVATAPVGSFDQQRLLAAPSCGARLDLLESLLTDEIAYLRGLLEMGGR